MTSLREQVEAMEQRCQAATPGPWNYLGDGVSFYGATSGAILRGIDRQIGSMDVLEDRKFVSNVRTDLPRVLAKFRQVVEALEQIAEGKGAYSQDRLEHADNTIRDMKDIAKVALAPMPTET